MKKVLSIVLALAMILCLCPTLAFAGEFTWYRYEDATVFVDNANKKITFSSGDKSGSLAIEAYNSYDVILDESFAGVITIDQNTWDVNSLTINGGTITADYDSFNLGAIHVENDLVINGGTIDIKVPEEKKINIETLDIEGALKMTGGSIKIDSYDDAIEVDGGFSISGGTVDLISLRDSGIYVDDGDATNSEIKGSANVKIAGSMGIEYHSDSSLTISGGTVNIDATVDSKNPAAYAIGSGSLSITGGDVTLAGVIAAVISESSVSITGGNPYLTATDSSAILSLGDIDIDGLELLGSKDANADVSDLEDELSVTEIDLEIGEVQKINAVVIYGTKDVAKTIAINKAEPEAPKIIEGQNQEVKIDTDKNAKFRSDAPFADFIEVQVDGKVVAPSNYKASEGSTIIELLPSFLKTLSVGKHTLAIVSKGGSANTNFTIVEEEVIENTDMPLGFVSTATVAMTMASVTVLGLGLVVLGTKKERDAD